VRCSICDKRIKKQETYYGDLGTLYEGKPLCEDCYYEDGPCATVIYGKDDTPYIISETKNETQGDFKVRWRSTDPWRGYYETSSEKYALVNTAELLAYHESERMLKEFDERIRELFNEHGIDYARVFARSSNVFYQNYDLYVKKDQALLAGLLVAKAKSEVDYDNPKWYRGIIFDEKALSKLVELFPEEKINTDLDAMKVVEKYGEETVSELQRRLKDKQKGD
jgi:hypothetical protein